jgi:L-fuculose-phosphate aldolase
VTDRTGAAQAIAGCCRRLWEAGLIAGADGNVSVRLTADRILVTPRGRLKADLAPEEMVEVSLDGAPLSGSQRATTELDLHLRIYRKSPGAGAVVHAHPPTATGFALAGQTLPPDLLPETVLLLGEVPLVPYATPGTPALGDLVEPLVDGHVALLLANHGAVTWAPDLALAQIRMESLEHAARIVLAARAVGTPVRLTPGQLASLEQRRGSSTHG